MAKEHERRRMSLQAPLRLVERPIVEAFTNAIIEVAAVGRVVPIARSLTTKRR
jgi:hypothetical protein